MLVLALQGLLAPALPAPCLLAATVRANSVPVSSKAILQKLPLRVYKRLEDVIAKCSYMEWKHFDAGVVKVRCRGSQPPSRLQAFACLQGLHGVLMGTGSMAGEHKLAAQEDSHVLCLCVSGFRASLFLPSLSDGIWFLAVWCGCLLRRRCWRSWRR